MHLSKTSISILYVFYILYMIVLVSINLFVYNTDKDPHKIWASLLNIGIAAYVTWNYFVYMKLLYVLKQEN